jgi:phosphoglycolate phosphatase-like HAD superfamily hydrolase
VRYRLAIFDVDGTLADTLPWFLRAVNRLAEAHGFNRIEAGDLATLRGSGARRVAAHLVIPAWQRPDLEPVRYPHEGYRRDTRMRTLVQRLNRLWHTPVEFYGSIARSQRPDCGTAC